MIAAIPHRGDQCTDRVFHGGRADLEIPGRFRVGAFGDPEILVRLLQDRVHDIDGVVEADQPPGGADAAKQTHDLLRRRPSHFVFRMKAVHICPPLSECVGQISNTIFSLLNVVGARAQRETETIAAVLNLTDQAKSAVFQTFFFNTLYGGRENAGAERPITIKRACFSTHGVAGSAL